MSAVTRPPAPPYYAVVFTSRRTSGDEAAYAEAAAGMMDLAARQPGFLGVDSARGSDGMGVTVSYWRDEASIAAWREEARHRAVQAQGRAAWYASYALHIARVERAYGFDADDPAT